MNSNRRPPPAGRMIAADDAASLLNALLYLGEAGRLDSRLPPERRRALHAALVNSLLYLAQTGHLDSSLPGEDLLALHRALGTVLAARQTPSDRRQAAPEPGLD